MPPTPSIAVVGATGAVGREMLEVLSQRRFPHASIRLFGSERSAGTSITYRGEQVRVEALREGMLRGPGIALFSAGSAISKLHAPAAVAQGMFVVDNSSAFRAEPSCPLIVPEVNPDDLGSRAEGAAPLAPMIAAVPNCSAIIMLVALNPLRLAFGVKRIVVSTYQAASGAGAAAMEELLTQSRDVLAGRPAVPRVFTEPYAFNLFSHNAAVDPASGYNGEELKVISESRRIWHDAGLLISPTCVRVPVLRAHCESINVTLSRAATRAEITAALSAAPSLRLVDDRERNAFPTPLKASGGDDVLVGRLRPDLSRVHELLGPDVTPTAETPCDRWELFVAGDQLRTGAALTAVKIAELMLARM
ncbi:MAG: aspartate-semialdehyde dehydrogenase [Phycisphaerales bacterium]